MSNLENLLGELKTNKPDKEEVNKLKKLMAELVEALKKKGFKASKTDVDAGYDEVASRYIYNVTTYINGDLFDVLKTLEFHPTLKKWRKYTGYDFMFKKGDIKIHVGGKDGKVEIFINKASAIQ